MCHSDILLYFFGFNHGDSLNCFKLSNRCLSRFRIVICWALIYLGVFASRYHVVFTDNLVLLQGYCYSMDHLVVLVSLSRGCQVVSMTEVKGSSWAFHYHCQMMGAQGHDNLDTDI